MRTQIRLDLFVGVPHAQVERIGTPVDPAGLREVHVRIDQAGSDPGTLHVHHPGIGRHRASGAGAGALDLAVPQDHDRVRRRGLASAIDQRAADQRSRRRRGAGRIGEGGRDRDAPALGRRAKDALRAARLLHFTVAHAVAVARVDDARRQWDELQILPIEDVRPATTSVLRQGLVSQVEPADAVERQRLGLEVAGEVGLAIAMPDRVEIALEQRAGRGKVGARRRRLGRRR